MIKVCVGVITGDFIRAKTVQTLISLAKASQYVGKIIIQQGPYIHLNRDTVVSIVQKGDSSHLFFVDNDVCFSPETLDRLVARNKDIIAAPYNRRTLPPESMVKMMVDGEIVSGNISELPKEPFKCYALGTGCMLIKMEVFEKIKRPWFFYGRYDEEEMGEDIWFCKKAHEAGYDVWADPTCQIGHLGEYIF